MEQYAIYLRKSRADNIEDSVEETLSRHEKLLLNTAKSMNLSITKIFREVVSGENISNRPKMQSLLKEVEEGLYAGVLVVEIERLARGNSIDQGIIAQCFQYSNTKIITPNKIIDPNDESDSEALEFGLFMSRREYKVINRRLQRGRLASVKEGKYVGNKPPFGYERVKIEKQKGFTLEPIQEQAEIVQMIFDLYAFGESHDGQPERLGVNLIARRLNSLKIPSATGGVWTSSTIRDILINPIYIGKIRWNWRPAIKKMIDGQIMRERPRAKAKDCIIVDGLHKGIIEPDIFNLVQQYMSNNPPRPIGENNKVANPLSGIVVCGKCGRKMLRRPYKNGYPDTLICAEPTCSNVGSQLSYVENRILEALAEWLNTYKLQWDANVTAKDGPIRSALSHKKKLLKESENEVKTLDKQKNTAHDLLEQGVYDIDTFLNRIKEIGERLQVAKDTITIIENDLAMEKTRSESKKNIIPKVEHLLKVYYELPSPKAKNDLLKEIIEKAIYVKEASGRWSGEVDKFELELFPRLPKTK